MKLANKDRSVSTNGIKMNQEIEQILDNFDFEKVYKVMKTLRWEWNFCGEYHIPNSEELRTEAARLLTIADGDIYQSVTAGGFVATKDETGLRLIFDFGKEDGYLSHSPKQFDIWYYLAIFFMVIGIAYAIFAFILKASFAPVWPIGMGFYISGAISIFRKIKNETR